MGVDLGDSVVAIILIIMTTNFKLKELKLSPKNLKSKRSKDVDMSKKSLYFLLILLAPTNHCSSF